MTMSDGAHMGVRAERTLQTILGDAEQPTEEEKQTPEQMYAWLKSAADASEFEQGEATAESYDEACRVTARAVLEHLEKHPEHMYHRPDGITESRHDQPPEDEIADDPREGWMQLSEDFWMRYTSPSLYDLMKDQGAKIPEGLTGFMWGWACNAARYALKLGPFDNPALLEIDTSS